MADAIRRIPPVKGDDPVEVTRAFRHLDHTIKGIDSELDALELLVAVDRKSLRAFSWMGF